MNRKLGQKANAPCSKSYFPSCRIIWKLFKQFQDNPSFKKWLTNMVFNLTYNKEGHPYEEPSLCRASKIGG